MAHVRAPVLVALTWDEVSGSTTIMYIYSGSKLIGRWPIFGGWPTHRVSTSGRIRKNLRGWGLARPFHHRNARGCPALPPALSGEWGFSSTSEGTSKILDKVSLFRYKCVYMIIVEINDSGAPANPPDIRRTLTDYARKSLKTRTDQGRISDGSRRIFARNSFVSRTA